MTLFYPLAQINPPQPALHYDEALVRLQQLQTQEDHTISPRCHTNFLGHGQQTEHAIVFIHGFTNCPYQFHQLAALFHQQGWNTLSIRLPGHGCADRLTTALRSVTPKQLIDVTNEGIDIGRGLGKQLTLFGFSLGGVLAAWAAQHRPDLAHAILVSPALGIQALPGHRRQVAAYLLTLSPNFFQWWHPSLKENPIEPLHAYPRFGSRALAAMLRLGLIVQQEARLAPPQARTVTVITNPTDQVVDNQTTAQVVAAWRAQGTPITTHEFPAAWGLIHDLIDPLQAEQQIGRVYPLLLHWSTEPNPLPLSSPGMFSSTPR
ncbi:MAG: alpha/beta fold hydrolase [Caldilineaceae bacterium]|nr:alpha/beta fold hydrolase [Caldilineaceae bacterium]